MNGQRSTFLLVFAIVLGLTLAGSEASVAQSDQVNRMIVYLECHDMSGKTSYGTGALISRDGYVLTAGHVAPKDWTCSGSVGSAEPGSLKTLVRQPLNSPVDVALFRFSAGAPFDFVTFCPLEDWMIRRPIIVAGYPGKTKTGVISFRQGVLSTTLTDPDGILETDGQSIEGMSGGPVFSRNLAGILGIVVGADFNATGEVSYYGILSAAQIADDVRILHQSDRSCYHKDRVLDLPAAVNDWHTGEVPLRVQAEDAACFISGLHGYLNADEDSVEVAVKDGEYVLTGFNRSGGLLAVDVRCLWYD